MSRLLLLVALASASVRAWRLLRFAPAGANAEERWNQNDDITVAAVRRSG